MWMRFGSSPTNGSSARTASAGGSGAPADAGGASASRQPARKAAARGRRMRALYHAAGSVLRRRLGSPALEVEHLRPPARGERAADLVAIVRRDRPVAPVGAAEPDGMPALPELA